MGIGGIESCEKSFLDIKRDSIKEMVKVLDTTFEKRHTSKFHRAALGSVLRSIQTECRELLELLKQDVQE